MRRALLRLNPANMDGLMLRADSYVKLGEFEVASRSAFSRCSFVGFLLFVFYAFSCVSCRHYKQALQYDPEQEDFKKKFRVILSFNSEISFPAF